jgi:nucleotide-binding universal stress UspA family protein
MEIRSILLNLDVFSYSPTVVKCAANLAQRFDADLIGVAAAEPFPPLMGTDGYGTPVRFYIEQREELEKRLHTMEAECRALVPAGVKLDWRTSVEPPNCLLASAACRADLIVTGSLLEGSGGSYYDHVNLGELVLTAGRPILVVGAGTAEIKAETIVIGWKNTREARRAVSDALPFLKSASDVIVATFEEGGREADRSSLRDVLDFLRRHDVKARGDVYPAVGGISAALEEISRMFGADLVVTGGYGHSRLREWLFGGMTKDLLAAPTLNRFMSN